MPKKRKEHEQRQQQRQRQGQRQSQALRKGSLVEVTSDEEGFKGAWYPATLLDVRPLPSSSRKKNRNPNSKTQKQYYVEYQSLVCEEDPSAPLREYVNAAFVRPVPPKETQPKPFALGDVVDANYTDGWWTGVIIQILEGNRFLVSFQNPPDEIEFGFPDLRFHREWVNGTWLRTANLKAAGVMFSVGKGVEVPFDQEGSLDGWFPATILEEIGNGFFMVEYQFRYRDGETKLLKSTIDSLHIRPCPPNFKDKNFFLLEKVDAFYDGGWWSGVITKELTDSKYKVFFKHTNKEREFTLSDLRPHMDWKEGKWFTSSQKVPIQSDNQNHEDRFCNNANNRGMAVSRRSSGSMKSTSEDKMNLNLNEVEKEARRLTPRNLTSSGVSSSLKERPRPASDIVDKACHHSTSAIETPNGEKLRHTAISNSENVGNKLSRQSIGGDQSSSNHSWGKRVKRKRMKLGEQEDMSSLSSRKTFDCSMKTQAKERQTSDEGLECEEMRNAIAKRSCPFADEESLTHIEDWDGLDDTELHTVKVTDQFDLEEKIQKRRRGRPPKSAAKTSKASGLGEVPSKDVEEFLVKDCLIYDDDALTTVEVSTSTDVLDFGQDFEIIGIKKVAKNQIRQKNKSGRTKTLSPMRIPSEEVVEHLAKQPEKPLRRGRKRTVNVNIVSHMLDSPIATEGRKTESDLKTKESEATTEQLPNNMLDDQPLSKWFEEMHSPATIDGSRASPRGDIEQSAEASGELLEIGETRTQIVGQLGIAKESCVVNDTNRTLKSELHSLPFVKNTLLWATVESMEVFKKMPQNPHFRPLEHCKESAREGLAIGCMVTYSSVVERTSRLQFDDPKSTIDDILETLLDLESHGFDVRVVRDRITALLSMKEKHKKLETEVEQLKGEILEHKVEKTKIDEGMDEIKNHMKVLEAKLFQAILAKENKDREITSLRSKLEGIKESIKNFQCDFEGLAASLL